MEIKLQSYWSLDEAELELLEPTPQPDIIEWAQENVYLPRAESDVHGFFNIEYSPYIADILRALTDNYTREVWVRAPLQSAKSLLAMIFISYIVEQSPGHSMICMPDENTVKRRMKGRIRPFFRANEFLMAELGGKIENLNIGEVTTLNYMNLYIAWAHSVASMSDVPVKIIIADEVKLFSESVGTDVDALNLLRGRQKTFANTSKFLGLSSPLLVGDLFDREFNDGLIHQYWLRCPLCDKFFLPDAEKLSELKLVRDSNRAFLEPKEYENDREGRLAWFECPKCSERLGDAERAWAVQFGRWCPEGCSIDEKGKITGSPPKTVRKSYSISAFCIHPRFQPLWKLAAAFVRAQLANKAGDRIPLQHFRNNYQGLAWEVKSAITKSNALSKRVEDYPAGSVPEGVQFLTAGIDVQVDHVWFIIMGWGYMAECWTIAEGRLETGDTRMLEHSQLLDDFLLQKFESVDEKFEFPIYLSGLDCAYRPDAVYAFCRISKADVIPVRGSDHVTGRVYKIYREKETELFRYDLNVNALKDRVYRLFFESVKPGPAYAHLHAGTGEIMFDHLTSEDRQFVPKNGKMVEIWKPKPGNPPNHLWDCLVYAMAAAEIRGLWQLRPIKKQAAAKKKGEGTDLKEKPIRTKY